MDLHGFIVIKIEGKKRTFASSEEVKPLKIESKAIPNGVITVIFFTLKISNFCLPFTFVYEKVVSSEEITKV